MCLAASAAILPLDVIGAVLPGLGIPACPLGALSRAACVAAVMTGLCARAHARSARTGGLTVYFGVMLLQMSWERLHGRNPFPPGSGLDLPEAFFWVAVPAYLLWGAGMAAAARAYARRTRAPCPSCRR